MRRLVKGAIAFGLGLLFTLWVSSCDVQDWWGGRSLLAVDPLPLPQLPEWIEQISPTAEAEGRSQIRIRFKEPLIPVESLDADPEKLALFEVVPQIPGRFRFLTPRLVGFQMDRALPKATRLRVTLKAGLSDLKNHRLEQDLAWTFNTEPIRLGNLPGVALDAPEDADPIDIQQAFEITSNVELDLSAFQKHASLVAEDATQTVRFRVKPKNESENAANNTTAHENENPDPEGGFDAAAKTWMYTLTPEQTLKKSTRYRLGVSPGLLPAQGNLPSEIPFVSRVKTYAPLTFEGLKSVGLPDGSGAFGRFVQGMGELQFTSGLSAASVEDNLTITPQPREGMRWFRAYEGDRVITLNPWALEPNTPYTITLKPGLKDKFGQTLGQSTSVQYRTGDVAADFWAPTDLHIFPARNSLQLNFSAINLPQPRYKAAFRVIQPAELVYNNTAYPTGEGKDFLPRPSAWETVTFDPKPQNESTEIAVQLRDRLGGPTGMLAYGVQARTYEYNQDGQKLWREPAYYGMVQLTNLGLFAQWFPQGGLVRVHHLSDGAAVEGAQVEIYRSRLEEKPSGIPQPCATGTTDATGTLVFSEANLSGCFQGNALFKQPPKLLAIAREGNDWAFVRTLEWSGDYGYGLMAGWNADTPESRGTIFSDRQLYQPGETGWFTGVAASLKNGELQLDKNGRYTITLEDPQGNSTALGTQTTNEFGTFSLELPLAANQSLGFYTLRARGERGAEISGEFRVAEFKPPNFKVDLSLDKRFAKIGETVTGQTQSNYLFGPPVEGGRLSYTVTRRRANLVPQGWESFAFGRQWFWPQEEPELQSDVLETSADLDASGSNRQSVTVGEDLPYPMTYRIDAEVTDVSNLAVADSQSFTALVSDRLIGLKSDFVATAQQPLNVEVIVTHPEGTAIAGQPVKLELQRMIYSSVTQMIEGSPTLRDQVEFQTVGQVEIRSGNTPQIATLTPTESGSYRIRANFANASVEATATDVQIWATGAGEVSWGDRYGNERLEVALDKETYQIGETATVLLQSPYPEAELYFAVIRNNTLYQTLTKVQGSAPRIQFQVTPEMLPNAAVEAVLLRQGAPLEQGTVEGLKDLVRIGFAPFKTNLGDRTLSASVTPERATLQPGATQTVKLTLRDANQAPVQGQFTVMVVNEAVRQLTDYRPPNLVETVYAEQPISTRFADNRPDVTLQPLTSPIDKGWGYGGGLSSGVGGTRLRTQFQPLAYYNGSVMTDANGEAAVSFTVPDNLTTWRIMVVAMNQEMQYGNAEATFVTSQPLVTHPILPQFARPGDRLSAGLSVTNNTGQNGNLKISGSASGALQLADNASANLQTQSSAGTQAYRFPLVAHAGGPGKIQFATQLNDQSDAFEFPLEIEPLEVTEQVVETGTTTSQVEIPIKIGNEAANDAGGLEITLASTLIPELQEPARQVLREQPLPFAETAASQLAIAAHLQRLAQTTGQPLSAAALGTTARSVLERLQRSDGGFAAYPQQERSDPFVSAYAAESLAAAQAANLPIDSNQVDRLQRYLQGVLTNPGQSDDCKAPACQDRLRLQTLTALAALGEVRSDFLSDLQGRQTSLDTIQQIQLAQHLSRFPEWQNEAAALTTRIEQQISETGRSATVNLPPGRGWLSSTTATQAQALQLLIVRQASPERLDRLVRSLLDLRRQGTWGSTADNAQAIAALTAYAQLQPTPPSFSASAQLAGKTVASAQFRGSEQPSISRTVPMRDLPRGNQTLTLRKSGNGTLHYLTAYRYRVQGNPPGRFNGLRVTRQVHPANSTKVLTRMGLLATEEVLTVKPGQVFEIELEIVTDHPVDHVVITDPLPAGFEAVDTRFQTSNTAQQVRSDRWQIGFQTIHRDRVVAYGDRLAPGVYTLHYLVRSVTPGTFLYPGSEVHLQYAPEEFGRAATTTLRIVD